MKDKDMGEIPQNPVGKKRNVTVEDRKGSYVENWQRLQGIMKTGLDIIRNEKIIQNASENLDQLLEKVKKEYDSTASEEENQALADCCLLGKAM